MAMVNCKYCGRLNSKVICDDCRREHKLSMKVEVSKK